MKNWTNKKPCDIIFEKFVLLVKKRKFFSHIDLEHSNLKHSCMHLIRDNNKSEYVCAKTGFSRIIFGVILVPPQLIPI
jgi:hypothetical protein